MHLHGGRKEQNFWRGFLGLVRHVVIVTLYLLDSQAYFGL